MIAGEISRVIYWYQGLSGWVQLGATPPTLPINTAMHLAIMWINTGDEDFAGHVALTVTKPDGSTVELTAVAYQNKPASPGDGWIVQFEPVVLDQAGSYQATAVLSRVIVGEFPVLDESTFTFASVAGAAVSDIWSMVGPLLVLGLMAGIVSMMAPMTEEGFS